MSWTRAVVDATLVIEVSSSDYTMFMLQLITQVSAEGHNPELYKHASNAQYSNVAKLLPFWALSLWSRPAAATS